MLASVRATDPCNSVARQAQRAARESEQIYIASTYLSITLAAMAEPIPRHVQPHRVHHQQWCSVSDASPTLFDTRAAIGTADTCRTDKRLILFLLHRFSSFRHQHPGRRPGYCRTRSTPSSRMPSVCGFRRNLSATSFAPTDSPEEMVTRPPACSVPCRL